MCERFRTSLRLNARRAGIQCTRLLTSATFSSDFLTVHRVIHRFEESIAGRDYLIEVASVAEDRWRAYIVRIPGVPTALMPFYGATPAEAARLLSEWLTRAHRRAANPAGSA